MYEFAILEHNIVDVDKSRKKDMGLPTRLHGVAVVEIFGVMKSFCPKCISIKEWKLVCIDDKYYKSCVKCGQKREIKTDEIDKLVTKAKEKKAGKK